MTSSTTFGTAAYGGPQWSPRTASLAEEVGAVWASGGADSEWRKLQAVVVHRPGSELEASANADAVQMLAPVDVGRAQAEHDEMVAAYRDSDVDVVYVEPAGSTTRPNQMFCADLMFPTPQGIILARPASTVRAGEEREVARRVADRGVPIVRSISGHGTFEGADAAWLDEHTVAVGIGHRTNPEAARQIASVLEEINVHTLTFDLPFGTMHLMGMLRVVAPNLAIAWPRRTPYRLVCELQERGFQVAFLPQGDDNDMNRAMNFVPLGPNRILMNGGYPAYQHFLEDLGVECVTVTARELVKAAGGFGCLTGVLSRQRAG